MSRNDSCDFAVAPRGASRNDELSRRLLPRTGCRDCAIVHQAKLTSKMSSAFSNESADESDGCSDDGWDVGNTINVKMRKGTRHTLRHSPHSRGSTNWPLQPRPFSLLRAPFVSWVVSLRCRSHLFLAGVGFVKILHRAHRVLAWEEGRARASCGVVAAASSGGGDSPAVWAGIRRRRGQLPLLHALICATGRLAVVILLSCAATVGIQLRHFPGADMDPSRMSVISNGNGDQAFPFKFTQGKAAATLQGLEKL